MEAFVREFGIVLGLLIAFAGVLLVYLKWALPSLTTAFLERAKFKEKEKADAARDKREQAAEAAAVERQEEITIVSQVIALQTRLVKQNDELIKFMTGTIDHELIEIKQKLELSEIKQELYDIDQRWLVVSKELGQASKERQATDAQISILMEMYKRTEERIMSLAAYKAINEQLRVGGRDEVSE